MTHVFVDGFNIKSYIKAKVSSQKNSMWVCLMQRCNKRLHIVTMTHSQTWLLPTFTRDWVEWRGKSYIYFFLLSCIVLGNNSLKITILCKRMNCFLVALEHMLYVIILMNPCCPIHIKSWKEGLWRTTKCHWRWRGCTEWRCHNARHDKYSRWSSIT